jgi:translation initiation factor 3 subunit J
MDSSDEDDEDDATRRRRLRETEINSDLVHAEDLFGAVQVPNNRVVKQTVILTDSKDPMSTIDLATMPLFNPKTKEQFTKLRETLIPLIGANSKHAQYTLFLQEFTKQICKDLPSEQIKKIASGLTTLSNEKMKEEKAAEKGGKKKNTKAKTVLKADKTFTSSKMVDTMAYDDDGLDEYGCAFSQHQASN